MASAGQDKVKDLFATEPDYWHLKSLRRTWTVTRFISLVTLCKGWYIELWRRKLFEVKKKVLEREFKSAVGDWTETECCGKQRHTYQIKTATLNPSRGVLKRLTINAVQLNSHKKWLELRYPTNESGKSVASCTGLFQGHCPSVRMQHRVIIV